MYTNNPTSSGMRGYGNPEGSFILQQAIDMAAEKCGMDPVEFRLKNARGVGEPSMWEPVVADELRPARAASSRGRSAIGWKDKWQGWGSKKEGRYRRGVGMSIMTHASGAGGFLLEHSTAIIKLNEDGSAQLTVSPCEMGQGILGALSQIAAEAMGLRFEDIHVITGDTDVTLFDIGTPRQPVHLRHRQRGVGRRQEGRGDRPGAGGKDARDDARRLGYPKRAGSS